MDWNCVEGNWKQFKGQVKEKWGNLTDDDWTKSGSSRSTGGNNPGAIWDREGPSQKRRRQRGWNWCDASDKSDTSRQKRTSQRCPLFLGRLEAMASFVLAAP